MSEATLSRTARPDIGKLDPYQFMAVIGKRVIHPGGQRSTDELFRLADFTPGQRVLDVGCGVGTSAIQMASRFRVHVDAVDISPIMLERAHRNIRAVGLQEKVTVKHGDILALDHAENSFDRVLAEAVTMFVDRSRAARELVRVCKPQGRVLATEFFWRKPPSAEAQEIFLGQVCPGMQIDDLDRWVQLYRDAGLESVEAVHGPFEMMTPSGFLADEGLARSLAIMCRVMGHLSYMKKMAWLMPRIQRAVPYLGYIAVCGTKPAGA